MYAQKSSTAKNDETAVNSHEQVVDLLFGSGRCVVSKAAIQLMELVHQTLKVNEPKDTIRFSICKTRILKFSLNHEIQKQIFITTFCFFICEVLS